ncbi:hypothetical protein OG871_39910 (plasmid) [Kitasatospora sp. NBC_00374]|uniref:hypothetical protein n=1 Tax=Kitasatospora sp. NBC_00374 TaxID=2975964 RepID=UPI002F909861
MTTSTSAVTDPTAPEKPAFVLPAPVRSGATAPPPGPDPEPQPAEAGPAPDPELAPPPGPDDEPDSVYLDDEQAQEPPEEESAEPERGRVAAVPLLVNGANLAVVAISGGGYYGGMTGVVAAGAATAAGAGIAGVAAVRSARTAAAATKAGGRAAGAAARGAGSAAGGAGRGIGGWLTGSRSGGGAGGGQRRSGGAGGAGRGPAGRSGGSGSFFGSGATGGGRSSAGGTGGRSSGSTGSTRQPLGTLGSTTSGRGAAQRGTGAGGTTRNGTSGLKGTHGNGRGGTSTSGTGAGRLTSAAGRSSTLGRGGGSGSRTGAGTGGGGSASGGARDSGRGRDGIGAARNRSARERGGDRPQVLKDWDKAKAGAARAGRRMFAWGRDRSAKAWTSSAAARRHARKAGKRWAKHMARMAGAGFLATLASLVVAPFGLLVGTFANIPAVFGYRPFTGFGMDWPARVWRKIWGWLGAGSRARMDAERRADQAAEDELDSGGDENDVAHAVDDPGSTAPTVAGMATTNSKGEHVSVFAQSAEAVAEAYRSYEPPVMASVAAEYRGLPGAIRHAMGAVMALAENSATQYPMDPAMAEKVSEVAQILESTAAYADDLEPAFRQAHKDDLLRHEEPRPGEDMWNVGGLKSDGSLWFAPSVLETAAEEVRTVYNNWSPKGMGMGAGAMAVGAEYEGIPVGLAHLAETVTSIAVRSAEIWPVEAVIAEMAGDIVHGLKQAESAAMELQPAFRRLHAKEIDNNENPRNGEEMWNVPEGGA